MQCPKCRTDVPEGHFYCPSCRTLIYNYRPERAARGPLERAGGRLLDLLLAVIIIGGLVLTARMVNWREFLANLRGEVKQVGQPERPTDRASTKPSPTPRRARANEPAPFKSPPLPESVRSLPQKPQKTEELPAVEFQPEIKLVPPSPPPTAPPTSKTTSPAKPGGH